MWDHHRAIQKENGYAKHVRVFARDIALNHGFSTGLKYLGWTFHFCPFGLTFKMTAVEEYFANS